ncbi:hypothetical protein BC332_13412 [Capsicum chinense]|nr:hypothetical protein BC332_13412 [Capsicum chinense]
MSLSFLESRKAMDDLALALKEVATEASKANKKLGATRLELFEIEVEQQVTFPVAVHRNGSYDDLVASVLESGDLDFRQSDMVISFLMHLRENMYPMIINNDRRVSLYKMDISDDGFRPILRINIVEKPFEEPLNSSPPPPRHL